jgi:hypothetical protein
MQTHDASDLLVMSGNRITTMLFSKRFGCFLVGLIYFVGALELGVNNEDLIFTILSIATIWFLFRYVSLSVFGGYEVDEHWKLVAISRVDDDSIIAAVKDGLDRIHHYKYEARWSEVGRGMVLDQRLILWLDSCLLKHR